MVWCRSVMIRPLLEKRRTVLLIVEKPDTPEAFESPEFERFTLGLISGPDSPDE
jgi:hypothetical protein